MRRYKKEPLYKRIGEANFNAFITPESSLKKRMRAIVNFIEHKDIGGEVDGQQSYVELVESENHMAFRVYFTIKCTPKEVKDWKKVTNKL